jgi:hypothetical protein
VSIESVFRTWLLGSAELSDLVGSRVYQNRAPQNAVYPLVVIQRTETDPTYDHGYLPDHAETRYLVKAYAKQYAELVAVKDALRGLDGYTRSAGLLFELNAVNPDSGGTFSRASTATYLDTEGDEVPARTVQIQAVRLVNDQDTWEDAAQLFGLVQHFMVFHTEAYTRGY